MVCGKCGAEVAPGAQFCTACGNSMERPMQPAYHAQAQAGSSSVLAILLIIFGVIIASFGVALTIYTIIEAGSYLEFWSVPGPLFLYMGPGLALVGIGAILNRMAKR
jgi:hypothetical protein